MRNILRSCLFFNFFVSIPFLTLSALEHPKDSLSCSWIKPVGTTGVVGQYKRLELGLELPSTYKTQIDKFIDGEKEGLNPFDPQHIDLRIIFTNPEGKKFKRFSFYFQSFRDELRGSGADPSIYINEYHKQATLSPWRVRFAPDQIGTWSVSIELLIKGVKIIEQKSSSFECVDSDHKGYLTVSSEGNNSDRWMYFSKTGEPFYAISENLSSAGECGYFPSQNKRMLQALDKFIAAGGNFTRFELGGQSALPDWPVHNNYADKLDEMHAFDRLIDKCEDNNVYFILFRHHVEVMSREDWALVRWQNNPYKLALGLQSVQDYFTDEDALKWQQNCLRYIYARWGYSANMTHYSYSEVDYWYSEVQKGIMEGSIEPISGRIRKTELAAEKYAAEVLKNWITGQKDYILNNLNDRAKFCFTYASVGKMEDQQKTSLFSLSDIVGIHVYGEKKDVNYSNRYEALERFWKELKKPVIIEEMGPNKVAMFCCTGIEFHNSIWSTAMMGGFGTGMDWWWDRGVFDFNYQKDLKAIRDFFKNEDLRSGGFRPQKWTDAFNFDKSKLENYYLISKDGERALGWIHNATYYWRNLADSNACLTNLINGMTQNSERCYFGKDPHGYPYDKYGTPCPWAYDDVYVQEDLKGFEKEEFKDKYTDNGGARPILPNEGLTFEIRGLKTTLSTKKYWYRVDFYSTQNGELILTPTFTQILKPNGSGVIRPFVPAMNSEHPDYAYKVIEIGRESKKRMNLNKAKEIEKR